MEEKKGRKIIIIVVLIFERVVAAKVNLELLEEGNKFFRERREILNIGGEVYRSRIRLKNWKSVLSLLEEDIQDCIVY